MSVRNAIVLLLALSALTFLVACGGSSSPKVVAPPSGGFSASNFKGNYVVSISGSDYHSTTNFPNGSAFALAGMLTADGSSNITGTLDVNDPALADSLGSSVFVQTALAATGTYRVTSDGRGTGNVTVIFDGQGETFGIDFVLNSNGQGLITRFDKTGSGSGTLDPQTVVGQSSLTSLAFTLSGADASLLPLATAGEISLDSSGNVTSGIQDLNDDGGATTNVPLTIPGSSLVLAAGGTSGTAVLQTTTFGAFDFDVWVIDATHLKLIETDANGQVLAGDAFTQETSIPSGNYAYTLGGLDSSQSPFVAGGLISSDGNGNLTGFEDFNDAGTGTAGTQPSISGVCTLSAGRCQIALSGFSNGLLAAFQFAAYPSSGGILLLEVDGNGLTLGAASAQSSTSFSTPQGYGLNLSGIDLNSGFEVDDIAEFTAQNVSSSGTGSLSGIVDVNDGGASPSMSLGGATFTPDSTADGRGSITTTPFNLEYYTVDSSTVIFIETDSSQTGMGTFQLQSASSSPAAMQPGVALLRQAARTHSVLRRYKKAVKK